MAIAEISHALAQAAAKYHRNAGNYAGFRYPAVCRYDRENVVRLRNKFAAVRCDRSAACPKTNSVSYRRLPAAETRNPLVSQAEYD